MLSFVLPLLSALLFAFAMALVPTRVMPPLAPMPSPSRLDWLGLGEGDRAGQRQDPQQCQQVTARAPGGQCPDETIESKSVHPRNLLGDSGGRKNAQSFPDGLTTRERS
jgi:hypothetical protein